MYVARNKIYELTIYTDIQMECNGNNNVDVSRYLDAFLAIW